MTKHAPRSLFGKRSSSDGGDSEDTDDWSDQSLYGFKETEIMRRRGLEQLTEAVDMIPSEQKVDYLYAKANAAPGVFEHESNPLRFLRVERYNAWAAARRFVTYWKLRREIFGPERAFLPMNLTGKGALTEPDMTLFNNPVFCLLPEDDSGRSVALIDRSQSAVYNVRAVFLFCQLLSQNDESQKRGPRVIFLVKNVGGASYSRHIMRKIGRVVREGMPMKPSQCHVICCASGHKKSSFLDTAVPLVLEKFGRNLSSRATFDFARSNADALAILERYGFRKQNLPPAVGGTLENAFADWQVRCGRIMTAGGLDDLTTLVNSALANYNKSFSSVRATKTNGSTATLIATAPASRPAAASEESDEEDEKERARKMRNVMYARKKRALHKIEREVLLQQIAVLRTKNSCLEDDNARLERILRTAQRALLRIDNSNK